MPGGAAVKNTAAWWCALRQRMSQKVQAGAAICTRPLNLRLRWFSMLLSNCALPMLHDTASHCHAWSCAACATPKGSQRSCSALWSMLAGRPDTRTEPAGGLAIASVFGGDGGDLKISGGAVGGGVGGAVGSACGGAGKLSPGERPPSETLAWKSTRRAHSLPAGRPLLPPVGSEPALELSGVQVSQAPRNGLPVD